MHNTETHLQTHGAEVWPSLREIFGCEVDQLCAWVREKQELVNADGWENFLFSVNDSQKKPKANVDRGTTQLHPSESVEERLPVHKFQLALCQS